MDVIKRLLKIFFILFISISCSNKDSSNTINEKAIANSCADLALKNENILKWKNGKISRLVFKNSTARKVYLEKHKQELLSVENNFRIPKPKLQNVQLLGFAGDINWGMKTINASALWSKNILGSGVVVAVVDSGIDPLHVQLQSQLYTNTKETLNGVDDDGNGLIDDIHGYDFVNKSGDLFDESGHGTHISGIIAAHHTQGDITGVAPQSQLIVYDFFGKSLNGSASDGSLFDAISGIRHAVQAGAKIINASWGGSSCSTTLQEEINSLASSNVLFIVAAGNEGSNLAIIPTYPASFDGRTQITVGAMTLDEYTAGFSNYGTKVDIVAPGVNILSTFPGNKYENMAGTSMATPFVSGASALLWSAFPQAQAVDIKEAILNSVKTGFYPVKTRGSLDVSAAYSYLEKKFPAPTTAPRR